eukprot:1159966-Pelagomonas_calceolata.AAC.4
MGLSLQPESLATRPAGPCQPTGSANSVCVFHQTFFTVGKSQGTQEMAIIFNLNISNFFCTQSNLFKGPLNPGSRVT